MDVRARVPAFKPPGKDELTRALREVADFRAPGQYVLHDWLAPQAAELAAAAVVPPAPAAGPAGAAARAGGPGGGGPRGPPPRRCRQGWARPAGRRRGKGRGRGRSARLSGVRRGGGVAWSGRGAPRGRRRQAAKALGWS